MKRLPQFNVYISKNLLNRLNSVDIVLILSYNIVDERYQILQSNRIGKWFYYIKLEALYRTPSYNLMSKCILFHCFFGILTYQTIIWLFIAVTGTPSFVNLLLRICQEAIKSVYKLLSLWGCILVSAVLFLFCTSSDVLFLNDSESSRFMFKLRKNILTLWLTSVNFHIGTPLRSW